VPKLGFYCATAREQVDLVAVEASEMEVLDRILELVSVGEHPDCLADLAVDRTLVIRLSGAAHVASFGRPAQYGTLLRG